MKNKKRGSENFGDEDITMVLIPSVVGGDHSPWGGGVRPL
jgi:hypothetical protein